MPAPDTFELLRRLDPAAHLAPAEPDARERLRRSIVATPVRQEPRRTPRSRGRVVLIVAVLALVLAAAGWGLRGSFLNDAQTARGEFDEAAAMLRLPPGATWSDPHLDDGFYGEGAGLMFAQSQATCAWFEYWNEGDAAQRAEAVAGFERIRATMTPRRPGAWEDEPGYSADSLRFYDGFIADMKRGEPTGIRQYLLANC